MLEVKNISISYGKAMIVKDVSFSLKAGEIIALLGANGAGKTTLLKSLNFSLPAGKGEISLDGEKIETYTRREIARKIAVIAQENETKFPVTVLEFVLAGRFSHGTGFGWETAGDLQIAADALEQCDLASYEHRLMNQLSGGERQRVILARALATQAEILLLDEPTTNLDLAHQAMMFRLIRRKCESDNLSAIVITHDLNLASEFADKILLLKNGEVLAEGKPADVLSAENLRTIFGVEILLDTNPVSKNVRVTTIY